MPDQKRTGLEAFAGPNNPFIAAAERMAKGYSLEDGFFRRRLIDIRRWLGHKDLEYRIQEAQWTADRTLRLIDLLVEKGVITEEEAADVREDYLNHD